MTPAAISVGDELPPFELPVTSTVIVAGAIASRDFMPAHHDAEFARGNFDGALAEYTHIYALLETHERRFFVLFNMGRCNERLFRYAEALEMARRAVAVTGP